MKKNLKMLLIPLLALLLAGCGVGELKKYENVDEMLADARQNVQFITVDELKAVLDKGSNGFYLIDCREQEQFDEACIMGATHIPRGELESKVSELAPRKRHTLYIYCDNEEKAILAASVLPGLKHPKVRVVQGGFDAVKEQQPSLVELSPQRDAPKADPQNAAPAGCGG